jgi:ubiquinone/menaquinone biosynthesis C-methylase UbiE
MSFKGRRHAEPVRMRRCGCKHLSPQQLWAREVIRTLKPAGDGRALDVGRRDGKVTAELVALVLQGTVLGTDSSKGIVE